MPRALSSHQASTLQAVGSLARAPLHTQHFTAPQPCGAQQPHPNPAKLLGSLPGYYLLQNKINSSHLLEKKQSEEASQAAHQLFDQPEERAQPSQGLKMRQLEPSAKEASWEGSVR